VDPLLLTSVDFSGRVFCVSVSDNHLPYEKRSEALGAADKCGSRRREGEEPKDHTIPGIDSIYCGDRFSRN